MPFASVPESVASASGSVKVVSDHSVSVPATLGQLPPKPKEEVVDVSEASNGSSGRQRDLGKGFYLLILNSYLNFGQSIRDRKNKLVEFCSSDIFVPHKNIFFHIFCDF